MSALPFVPESTLRSLCEPVYSVSEAQQVIRELQHWYDKVDGCAGLAAPQIGIAKSVAIIRVQDHFIDLINPTIQEVKDPFVFHGEGCMSFPGRVWNVPRFKQITLEVNAIWPPEKPLPQGISPKVDLIHPQQLVVQTLHWMYEHPNDDFPNLLPIVIQHEMDHLLGVCLPWKEGAIEAEIPKPIEVGVRVGRNDPCPCGSSKKFKKCCLSKMPSHGVAVNHPAF